MLVISLPVLFGCLFDPFHDIGDAVGAKGVQVEYPHILLVVEIMHGGAGCVEHYSVRYNTSDDHVVVPELYPRRSTLRIRFRILWVES